MIHLSEPMTFFWTHRAGVPHAECGRFYPRPFVIEGTVFGCCEQWMHWRKAMLFGDEVMAAAIMMETDPVRQKALGRRVANFSATIWNAVARDIVLRGNVAKFSQHRDLLETLRQTRGTTLVEASPRDRIWGIGLAKDDPRALQRATWQGSNWLGEVLTELRVAFCGS